MASKVTVSTPESWKTVMDFEVTAEEVGEAVGKKTTEYSKGIRLPGFRKGKVPLQLVQSRYGKAIRSEVIEDLIQKSFEDACKERGIIPVSEPRVKKVDLDEGKPLAFTIETEVDPQIEIKGYDKLKVRPSPRKIKKNDVTKALEELQDRLANFVDVDRGARKGDFVMLTYVEVKVEGEVKKDLTSPSYPIEIGAGKIKDFDKGLMGRAAGETVGVSIRFPSDYGDGELAGKHTDMTIRIDKVQEKRIAEINEEFLKKVGDFKDEDALRQFLENDLQSRENARARNEAYNKAIEQLLDKNVFPVPPSRVERYVDLVYEDMQRHAKQNKGVAPQREEVAQRYRPIAERTIRRMRVLHYIAQKENIRVTPEEVDAEVRKIADRYSQPFEQVREALRGNGTLDRIRADLHEMKTLDFLIGEPQIQDQPSGDGEP